MRRGEPTETTDPRATRLRIGAYGFVAGALMALPLVSGELPSGVGERLWWGISAGIGGFISARWFSPKFGRPRPGGWTRTVGASIKAAFLGSIIGAALALPPLGMSLAPFFMIGQWSIFFLDRLPKRQQAEAEFLFTFPGFVTFCTVLVLLASIGHLLARRIRRRHVQSRR